MIKQKKCKGQGKAISFQGCGKLVNVAFRKYGLCSSCYAEFLTETEVGKVILSKALNKVKKAVFDEKKAKENTTDWNKKLQTKINLIVRLIDFNQPCLAKNKLANQMHAGHVFSRGSNPMLRFNLHNIHRQSAQSNHFQNEDGLFREGIIKEYGILYFEFISNLRQIKDLKISNDTYIELYKKASKIALKLAKQQKEYTLNERLFLRNEINIEIGIYDYKFCIFTKSRTSDITI
jgi:hypothetical protein